MIKCDIVTKEDGAMSCQECGIAFAIGDPYYLSYFEGEDSETVADVFEVLCTNCYVYFGEN